MTPNLIHKSTPAELLLLLVALSFAALTGLEALPSPVLLPIVAFAILAFTACALSNGVFSLNLILILLIIQNPLLILGSRLIGGLETNAIIAVKELLTYGLVALACLRQGPKELLKNPVDKVAFTYLAVVALYVLIPSEIPIFAKAVSARQVALPAILYLLGRSLVLSSEGLNRHIRFLYILSFGIVITGFLEQVLFPESIWFDLGIFSYMINKGLELWARGSLNFYSYDLQPLVGIVIKRMTGIFADPTTTGHFLAIPAAIALAHSAKRTFNPQVGILFFIGTLLCFSKGGTLVLLVYGWWYLRDNPRTRVLATSIFVSGLLGAIAAVLYAITHPTSITNHMFGFVTNLLSIAQYPFGRGIGYSGNFAALFSGLGKDEVGAGESFIGSIIGQMGLPGLLLTVIFTAVLVTALSRVENAGEKELSRVIGGLILGTVIASLLSESAMSYLGTGLTFIYAGILITPRQPQEECA